LDNLGQKNKLNEEEIMNYNKKIDSLNSVKNELNSQISILNNELEKTNDISFKCVKLNSAKLSHERELKLKIEEINRVKNELESIKKRYDEKEKFEKEILNNHQLNLRKF